MLPPVTGVVTRPRIQARIRSGKEPAVIASNPSIQLPFALASGGQGRSFENIKLPASAVSQFLPQHSTMVSYCTVPVSDRMASSGSQSTTKMLTKYKFYSWFYSAFTTSGIGTTHRSAHRDAWGTVITNLRKPLRIQYLAAHVSNRLQVPVPNKVPNLG
ncbi:hypothetical protein EDB89DRAFT_2001547 [Lactarius sanguifluus]|nr:hypothetical protein EDB89DRAFT_2001547 [Lactarius sanguifluus]